MNSSEREEQLARELLSDLDLYAHIRLSHPPEYEKDVEKLRVALTSERELGVAAVLREQADSANLARGVAIEQAAQAVTNHLRSNESERDGILIQAASWIRSLASTDAAQALAAHDAGLRSALFEAAIPLEVIAGQLNIGNMQEISVELAQQIHIGLRLIRAALAKSPAPAKDGEI